MEVEDGEIADAAEKLSNGSKDHPDRVSVKRSRSPTKTSPSRDSKLARVEVADDAKTRSETAAASPDSSHRDPSRPDGDSRGRSKENGDSGAAARSSKRDSDRPHRSKRSRSRSHSRSRDRSRRSRSRSRDRARDRDSSRRRAASPRSPKDSDRFDSKSASDDQARKERDQRERDDADRKRKERERDARDRSRERAKQRDKERELERARERERRDKEAKSRRRSPSPYRRGGPGNTGRNADDRRSNRDSTPAGSGSKSSTNKPGSVSVAAALGALPPVDPDHANLARGISQEDDEEYQRRVEAQLADMDTDETEEERLERERKEREALLARLQAVAPPPRSSNRPANGAQRSKKGSDDDDNDDNDSMHPEPSPSSPNASPPISTARPNGTSAVVSSAAVHMYDKHPTNLTQAMAETREILQRKQQEEDDEMRAQQEREARDGFAGVSHDHIDIFNANSAAVLDLFDVNALRTVATSAAGSRPIGGAAAPLVATAVTSGGTGVGDLNLQDNWDDTEGYYRFRPGDLLDGRFDVYANQGQGVFSSVLRVRDLKSVDHRDYVIKLIRNKETMLKAGQKELEFLRLLAAKDPDNKRHIVRLIAHFEHKNHLCMVFEPLFKNLRELLRKFGNVGLHISAVRSYAQQLFIALRQLKKCGILHADIKPDNILVNEKMSNIKLCDFGSASKVTECEITPLLVSRFYRPPEIMLGLPYAEPVDMWSVGCVLFELYTGKILFAGKDNNDMLRLFLETKGRFPAKMVKKGMFRAEHFAEDGYTFLFQKTDVHSGMTLAEARKYEKPLVTLREKLLSFSTDADQESVLQLADLLDKALTVDPTKRLTPEGALDHPFVKLNQGRPLSP